MISPFWIAGLLGTPHHLGWRSVTTDAPSGTWTRYLLVRHHVQWDTASPLARKQQTHRHLAPCTQRVCPLCFSAAKKKEPNPDFQTQAPIDASGASIAASKLAHDSRAPQYYSGHPGPIASYPCLGFLLLGCSRWVSLLIGGPRTPHNQIYTAAPCTSYDQYDQL